MYIFRSISVEGVVDVAEESHQPDGDVCAQSQLEVPVPYDPLGRAGGLPGLVDLISESGGTS